MENYHIGQVEATLGITLYVFGLGLGPLFFSPISEKYGRKPVYLTSLVVCCMAQFLSAFGVRIALILAARFLAGFAGSAYMSVVPGTLADLFSESELSGPVLLFTIGPFVGPGAGPLFGGLIVQYIDYHWVFYIMLIFSMVLLVVVILFVPETSEPHLLAVKARRIRKQVGNQVAYAAIEKKPHENLVLDMVSSCKKPLSMLIFDPMMVLLCLYSGILLAIIYLDFVAYRYIFAERVYHLDSALLGLTYMGITIGMLLAVTTQSFWNKVNRKLNITNGSEPENILPQMMAGACICPLGLLIFAWTISPSIHPIVPLIGSCVFGFGALLVFNSIFFYTVEAYGKHAASAMGTNCFVRNSMSAVFPLFGIQLYETLGYHWAPTLLAGLTLILIPMPFLFYRYGKHLRGKSRFTWID